MARTSAKAKKSKEEIRVSKVKSQSKGDQDAVKGDNVASETDKEKDESNFEVEKIVHTRIYKGKRQYLVRWKDYKDDSDTWETESALHACPDVLEAFKKENTPITDQIEVSNASKSNKKGNKLIKTVATEISNKDKKNNDDQSNTESEKEEEIENSGKNRKKKVQKEKKNNDDQSNTESEKEEEIENSEKNRKKKVQKEKKNNDDQSNTESEKEEEIENSEKNRKKKVQKEVTKEEQLNTESDEEKERDDSVKKGKKRVKKGVPKRQGKKFKAEVVSSSNNEKDQKSEGSDDESVTDGKNYEVEKILEVHTKKDGSHEFLIRWKGYKPNEDTWEPEAHLNCHELISKFMEKVDKAKNIPVRELRESRTQGGRYIPSQSTKKRTNLRNLGFRPSYAESYAE